MKIDTDGNVRVYSLIVHERRNKWEVQWQTLSQSCKIYGRICSCIHGYRMPCTQDDCDFIELHQTEFYGYDIRFLPNLTVDACKKDCLHDNSCRGFQFGWKEDVRSYYCFKKTSLHNGYQIGFDSTMYIKLPKKLVSSFYEKTTGQSNFSRPHPMLTPIIRSYEKKHDIEPLGFMLTFGCTIGGGFNRSNFSMIRGIRGYMAPEWVFNLPVTSKVDVYSYGMVVLEMITGRNPVGKCHTCNANDEIELALIDWVRDKLQEFNGSQMNSWLEDIVDLQ
ncbi:Apple-like protein [Cynara cardunculus var. scolymus]|uniref:Apple-like protein n=1 Tax=Cynara cardunculus var. scolymus TaxID=59895 RepID=A0A103Y6D3_CYNCS|nr:Apple-like protein [Cynara cardunculus var. scolymus]